MSGEIFYGRMVRRSEGSWTARALSDGGRRTIGSFYFFLEPPDTTQLTHTLLKKLNARLTRLVTKKFCASSVKRSNKLYVPVHIYVFF